MRLVDRIAQGCAPYVVQDRNTGALTHLNGAADHAAAVASCPMRFVLTDDLTRLCTALAYSKGAHQLACADLLRIPAEHIWIEWCGEGDAPGRCGALIRASRDGRSGLIRTFWSVGDTPSDVLASNVEAYFDLDTAEGAEPAAPDQLNLPTRCVQDGVEGEPGILQRYFRFRYERSWARYYERARLPSQSEAAVAHYALGTIAADIPMILSFFLLLSTRSGLPQRVQSLEKLNRARARSGKAPLLEHIEVCAPVLHEMQALQCDESPRGRRAPRLHHVRGHLVRRGSQLFWRMPHLRGTARSGVVRTRTVTWTIDRPAAQAVARSAQEARI